MSLKDSIWSSREYYSRIENNEKFDHPGFLLAVKVSKTSKEILDVGCGDGSKLNRLGNDTTQKYGCEISAEGISVGRRNFPDLKFSHYDGKKLPYRATKFDLVTSFFVLEHTNNPHELVPEMIRVLKMGGKLLLVAPNFGSPSRSSPNFIGSRSEKLVRGFIMDFKAKTSLDWNKVTPTIRSMKEFEPDLDTTVEPYLGSLVKFLEQNNMEILQANSCWDLELNTAKVVQKIVAVFGRLGVYPFKYWGPHLVVLAQKR